MNKLFLKVQIYAFRRKLLVEQNILEMPSKILIKFEIKQILLNFPTEEEEILFIGRLTNSGYKI